MNEDLILQMIAELCEDDAVLTDRDLDLYESGLLDSLGFTDLLLAIEDRFGLEIPATSIGREDTATPRRIVRLVRKTAEEREKTL
ncbi:MAG: D-alanine--poly(phosphoribitol) ligase subunit 2 [Oscillospiraceae bacterium]|nr:D-alanine--poly(phosphoribitol) ligase subunit 2 [Oscillospiraceae bacterium]